ncbi:MAG: DUF998 domain-containing protein [Nitrospirae bacterium]|nr:DUF998 domain-containing protein [Nitrospirota bacterium]
MASGERLNRRLTRLWGGLFAIVGVVVFIVIVVALHFLQPGYDPANQLMSELALGPHGWAMLPAFISLSLSVFGLQAALGPFGASRALRLILVVASVFFLASGVFPLGAASELHIAFIIAAFILVVLAMYLLPSSAGHAGTLLPRMLSWGLAAGVAVSVALGDSLLPVGIGQRLAAISLLLWLAIVGWTLARR